MTVEDRRRRHLAHVLLEHTRRGCACDLCGHCAQRLYELACGSRAPSASCVACSGAVYADGFCAACREERAALESGRCPACDRGASVSGGPGPLACRACGWNGPAALAAGLLLRPRLLGLPDARPAAPGPRGGARRRR